MKELFDQKWWSHCLFQFTDSKTSAFPVCKSRTLVTNVRVAVAEAFHPRHNDRLVTRVAHAGRCGAAHTASLRPARKETPASCSAVASSDAPGDTGPNARQATPPPPLYALCALSIVTTAIRPARSAPSVVSACTWTACTPGQPFPSRRCNAFIAGLRSLLLATYNGSLAFIASTLGRCSS